MDMPVIELASHIVETKRGKFEPKKFEDHYEDALKDLLSKKKKGEKIEPPKEAAASNVVDLMEALRQSVGGGRHRKTASRGKAHRRAGKRPAAARQKTAS
jgi:DNA end-binding protein Ku